MIQVGEDMGAFVGNNVSGPIMGSHTAYPTVCTGTLYFPEFQKWVRRGAVLKYEVR